MYCALASQVDDDKGQHCPELTTLESAHVLESQS